MDFGLKGKIAIIGGSSKGLGKACAIALAREGVNIVLCARSKESLHETGKEIKQYGVDVLTVVADMSVAEDNERIVKETISRFGQIDILINNSGGSKPGTFREVSLDNMDEAYNSILKYNVRMTNLCLPYMERAGWGRIVNITSITVKEPAENMVLSNIFRASVVSYAKTISRGLIGKGVTVNNVCPGYFKTDRVIQLIDAHSKAEGISPQEVEEKITSTFPHKRYMNPQELGDYVSYLCSSQARSITGTTVQIDGGLIRSLY